MGTWTLPHNIQDFEPSYYNWNKKEIKKREGVKQVIMSQCPNYGSVFLDTYYNNQGSSSSLCQCIWDCTIVTAHPQNTITVSINKPTLWAASAFLSRLLFFMQMALVRCRWATILDIKKSFLVQLLKLNAEAEFPSFFFSFFFNCFSACSFFLRSAKSCFSFLLCSANNRFSSFSEFSVISFFPSLSLSFSLLCCFFLELLQKLTICNTYWLGVYWFLFPLSSIISRTREFKYVIRQKLSASCLGFATFFRTMSFQEDDAESLQLLTSGWLIRSHALYSRLRMSYPSLYSVSWTVLLFLVRTEDSLTPLVRYRSCNSVDRIKILEGVVCLSLTSLGLRGNTPHFLKPDMMLTGVKEEGQASATNNANLSVVAILSLDW